MRAPCRDPSRQHQRLLDGVGRSHSANVAAVELWRQQLDGLRDGGHPGRQLQFQPLANLGIGHGAADGGAGYTYFDPKTGHEFSVVTGLTYNLLNPSTGYQNGVDWHVDWGASQFVTNSCSLAPLAISFSRSRLTAALLLSSDQSRVLRVSVPKSDTFSLSVTYKGM